MLLNIMDSPLPFGKSRGFLFALSKEEILPFYDLWMTDTHIHELIINGYLVVSVVCSDRDSVHSLTFVASLISSAPTGKVNW